MIFASELGKFAYTACTKSNLIATQVFWVSVLSYMPHHVPLKFRSPTKWGEDIGPTFLYQHPIFQVQELLLDNHHETILSTIVFSRLFFEGNLHAHSTRKA